MWRFGLRNTYNHLCLLQAQMAFHRTFCQRYHIVHPGIVSPERPVPEHIQKPAYDLPAKSWFRSLSLRRQKPEIKSQKQIIGMRDSCKLARDILQAAGEYADEGVTTDCIDDFVHDLAILNNAYPSPLNYKHFPKSICTSINNVGCHGIPDDRPLQDGDIINIDITVYFNGYHGDTSETFLIGEVDETGQRLVDAARECRDAAIEVCGPGRPLHTIGKTISAISAARGFNVIPDFCGHGIGDYFHGPPNIIHVDNSFPGTMEAGMTFTIEPVITEGCQDFTILPDGWTAISTDDSRSAQFEHTILITRDGVEILTL